jgi:hypothetical protein
MNPSVANVRTDLLIAEFKLAIANIHEHCAKWDERLRRRSVKGYQLPGVHFTQHHTEE